VFLMFNNVVNTILGCRLNSQSCTSLITTKIINVNECIAANLHQLRTCVNIKAMC